MGRAIVAVCRLVVGLLLSMAGCGREERLDARVVATDGFSPEQASLTALTAGTPPSSSVPDGFEQWFKDVCPNDRALRVTTQTGGSFDTVCEEVRETVLADDRVRGALIRFYLATAQTEAPTMGEPSGERVGEAKQPFSPLGFLCGIVVSTLIARQCEKVGYNWNQCAAAGVVPTFMCALI
jgi:hypothetical protein